MADIAKRLAFEDLSVTLSSLVDGSMAPDIRAKLAELISTYEQHKLNFEGRLSDARDQAVKLAQGMAGRPAPSKHQLRGLKSSLLNLTQKQLFAEALLNCSDTLELHLDGEECTAATLKSAAEDMKDLKKQNKQEEEHLQATIQTIDQYQGQHQQALARVALKLDMTAKELAALESSKLPPPTPTPATVNEDDLEGQISQQSQAAISLEARLAQTESACQDLEGDLQAHQSELFRLEAEITKLTSIKQDEARLVEQRHKEALAWCDTMVDILVLTTGVSLVSIGEDVVTLRLHHERGNGQQTLPQNGVSPAQHTLTAQLQPGTTLLRQASLEPPSVDIAPLVHFAQETGGGLPLLLTMVRNLTLADMST